MAVRIEVEKSGNNVVLRSPEHPLLADKASALGGKLRGSNWTFPGNKEDAVKALARSLWGSDGRDKATSTLRVELSLYGEGPMGRQGEAWLCGRLLARRRTFDSPVELGPGVKLVSGSFASWGGSPGRPALGARYGTVVDVADVPASAAQGAEKEFPYEVKSVVHGDAVVGAWARSVTDRIVGAKARAEAKLSGKAPKPAPAAKAAPVRAAKPVPAAKAAPAPKAAPMPKAGAVKKAAKKVVAAAKSVTLAAKKASKKATKKAATAAKAVKAVAKKVAAKAKAPVRKPAKKAARKPAKKVAPKAVKKTAPKKAARPAPKPAKKAAPRKAAKKPTARKKSGKRGRR